MGLTIHYDLSLPGETPAVEVREKLERLRQAARDLPVASVSESLLCLRPGECGESRLAALRESREPGDQDLRSLLIRAARLVAYDYEASGKPRVGKLGEVGHMLGVQPRQLSCFTVDVGPGCEFAHFGMARYPKVVLVKGQQSFYKRRFRLPVEHADKWIWHGFAKTQYASVGDAGGVENFLRCHLSLIAILDAAKGLGLGVEVSDEGGFWEKRDVKALCGDLHDMNERMAGLVGLLKDATQNAGDAAFTSPLLGTPEFERLEAKGREKIDPKLAGLIIKVARRG